jgi:hypothetical protein
MRKLALFATVVCLISCYGMNAEGQTVTLAWGSHYVGPSKSKTEGDTHGTVGMNQLCQTAYGTTAHICTVDEFFQSAAFAESSAGAPEMWVQPSFTDCVYDTGKEEVTCRMAEVGRVVESMYDLSCLHWTTSNQGYSGTVIVDTSGTSASGAVVTSGNCGKSELVACCAP